MDLCSILNDLLLQRPNRRGSDIEYNGLPYTRDIERPGHYGPDRLAGTIVTHKS